MLTFLRKKMKTIMIVVAVVFAASMFYGIASSRGGGQSQTRAGLAKVNGKMVDPHRYNEIANRIIGQFSDEIKPQDLAFIQNLAIGQAVDFTLVLAQAKKQVRVSGYEVNMSLDNIMKQGEFTSKKQLETALKRSGISLSKFKQMLKNEMMVQKMVTKVRQGVAVTPDDLREIKASHILISDEAKAKELLARIKKGEDFAALAKSHSIDDGSGKKGGDLGFFTTGRMVAPFEQAAFALKVGEVSDLVKSSFGYHIIKVTDSKLRKFEGEEKDIEKAALAEKQGQVFQKWFSEIKSKAKVEIISPELRAHSWRFRGRLREAIEEYKQAISQNPSNPYLHVFLGDTYNTVGDKESAIAQYQRAVEVSGGNPELYIILAQAYEKSENKPEAVKQYKRASLVAGDNKAMHERLLDIFKELQAWPEYNREKEELKRIEKKEKFEEEFKSEKE
ncbi:peptidylprolyl isomerase [Candidatus Margulisiibacteriota bacterium]